MSREEKVERISEREYILCTKELPQKGKVNAWVVLLLAKMFDVHPKKVIIKNPTSRRKVVEILP